jgi:hypothetical protein
MDDASIARLVASLRALDAARARPRPHATDILARAAARAAAPSPAQTAPGTTSTRATPGPSWRPSSD